MNKNVKQHVIDNQKVLFKFYQSGSLWYETEKGLLFEVSISETGNGVFNREEKSITMMKWINKQLDANDSAKELCDKVRLEDVRENLKRSMKMAKDLNRALRGQL